MKKQLLLFLTVICLIGFTTPTIPQTHDIVGKWLGNDANQLGYIVLDGEGYAHFLIKARVFGGKNFKLGEDDAQMTYELTNITKDSKHFKLDFIITLTANQTEDKRMKCLLRWIDENNFELASNYNDKRPEDFTSENTVQFKRIE